MSLRRFAWIVVLGAACSKGDKGGGAGDPPGPATAAKSVEPKPPAAKGVTGTLLLDGTLAGAFRWGPDMALESCFCRPAEKLGSVDITMSDGKDTWISTTLRTNGEVVLRNGQGKIKGALERAGGSVSGTCSIDEMTVSMSLDVDAKLESAAGDRITMKGKLDVVCP